VATDIGFDRHLDVGVAFPDPHPANASHHDVSHHHGRIGFECIDIRDLDVINAGARPAANRAGQR
jgi:hypothetical protein